MLLLHIISDQTQVDIVKTIKKFAVNLLIQLPFGVCFLSKLMDLTAETFHHPFLSQLAHLNHAHWSNLECELIITRLHLQHKTCQIH